MKFSSESQVGSEYRLQAHNVALSEAAEKFLRYFLMGIIIWHLTSEYTEQCIRVIKRHSAVNFTRINSNLSNPMPQVHHNAPAMD